MRALLIIAVALAGCAQPSDPVATGLGLADLGVEEAGPAHGDAEAAVQVVAFEAPACSACRHFHQNAYRGLLADFVETGDVRWYHQQWTIGYGFDERGSIALECTYTHGGDAPYWDFLDRVYSSDYPQYSGMSADEVVAELEALADRHALDSDALVACFEDAATSDEVAADIRGGTSNGARSSPAFFVLGPDGVTLTGSSGLRAAIEDALA